MAAEMAIENRPFNFEDFMETYPPGMTEEEQENVEIVKARLMPNQGGLHNVKIRRPKNGRAHDAELLIDGKVINGVTSLQINVEAGNLTRLTIEMIAENISFDGSAMVEVNANET